MQVLVSNDVEDVMLGIEWLSRNECRWHFADG